MQQYLLYISHNRQKLFFVMKKLRPVVYRFIFMVVIIIAAGLITGAFYDSSIISFTPRYVFAVFLGAAAGTAASYAVEYIARKASAKK